MTQPLQRRTPGSRAWAAVLPVLLGGAVALALLVLLTDADPSRAGTVAEIADDPWAFDGREMTLRGTVAVPSAQLPRDAGEAFVLSGAAGNRLLVHPLRGAPSLFEGASVEVRGTVRAPRAAADERRPETAPVTQTDLIGRVGARATVEAAHVVLREEET